jgi:hypothetical protein
MTKRADMTAYGRMQDDKRNAAKRKPNTGKRAQAAVVGTCGAEKKHGKGKCKNPSGWGTDHAGIGRCRFHAGNTPNSRKAAARHQAVLMGAPRDINPLDALIWCIKLTAGEVEFFNSQLAELKKEKWYEETVIGKQLHILARERAKSIERLAKFSKDAIGLGLAERAVRMAEQYGSSLAMFIKGVLGDLELTKEQVAIAPGIVRKHLILLEQRAPVTDEDRREPLAAIPKRTSRTEVAG